MRTDILLFESVHRFWWLSFQKQSLYLILRSDSFDKQKDFNQL